MLLTNPLTSSDVHIYYFQANSEQMAYARALHERIRRECKMCLGE